MIAGSPVSNDMATLQEIGDGVVAYVQPDGSWGLSNSGLIVGEQSTLLIDTLFDLAHTQRMLEIYGKYRAGRSVADVVLNTHANGDHCYGNAALPSRRIIASRRAAAEMRGMPPKKLASLMKVARLATSLGALRPGLGRLLGAAGLRLGADLVTAAPYVRDAFARFDFDGIDFVLPNETFEGELQLDLGNKVVRLIEVGPAHTEGDVIAFLPETRTLFSGDLLFEGMHPLIWAGTLSGYRESLDRLLALEPTVIVPGHGPVTDVRAIRRHVDYCVALRREVEPLYRTGVSAESAARTLMREGFGHLREPERLAVNVCAAYRDLSGVNQSTNVIAAFASMARLAEARSKLA